MHPEDFDTPVVGCLCYQAMSEWHLGEIVACRYLSLKAETLHLADRTPEAIEAINEAERLAESFEDRVACTNLHRLRSVFLATMGAGETQI